MAFLKLPVAITLSAIRNWQKNGKTCVAAFVTKGLINESLYLELSDDDLPPLSRPQKRYAIDAYYVAEEVRRILFAHFGDTAYQRGFNVYTTIQSRLQVAAVNALRQGLLAHESRRKYRGAEKFIDIRGLDKAAIAKKLDNEPSWGGLQPAVIIAADKKSAKVIAQNGEPTKKLWGRQGGICREAGNRR